MTELPQLSVFKFFVLHANIILCTTAICSFWLSLAHSGSLSLAHSRTFWLILTHSGSHWISLRLSQTQSAHKVLARLFTSWTCGRSLFRPGMMTSLIQCEYMLLFWFSFPINVRVWLRDKQGLDEYIPERIFSIVGAVVKVQHKRMTTTIKWDSYGKLWKRS